MVDWQHIGTGSAAESRDVRERIRLLETRALALLRTAVTDPRAAEAQRSLAAFEAEIAMVRADLAWRRRYPFTPVRSRLTTTYVCTGAANDRAP